MRQPASTAPSRPIRARGGSVVAGLTVAAYTLALVQRPGLATSDTKIDLHVDPAGFLGSVAAVWSPTGSLGHVQGGQYSGYLWPMGPFFAALHGVGLAPWLIQRLWLGTLLALAAWGTVRLLDRMLDAPRGVPHLVAGAIVLLNPYVVVFSSRTTITLLGYAALPWLLLAIQRGVRVPRGWWWPAAFALLVVSTAPGVNAAVTGWILVGPLLLLLYEPLLGHVRWREAGQFAWRAAAATALASVWWLVPVLVQAAYGIDFLKFTEQIGSIWFTTSISESLRLMGYWPSYLGVGYMGALTPYFGDAGTMLFNPVVVVSSLLVPALALTGFIWTRRWRYGPFFVALALVGVAIMSVGFPDGTPGRRGADFLYNHIHVAQFLRTTYKAGPLVAIAIACLAGAAAPALWRRLRAPARLGAAIAAAALLCLAALPMVEGRAVELTWSRIPPAWTAVARDLDRQLPANTRAVVLPGQAFAFYRWGGTVDPILPALTRRPVAVRNVPPYDDLHAVDMLWTVDNLVQQQRLLPGELPPLLDLMSAGSVVTGTDDDTARSGAIPPAEAAQALSAQPGLARPSRAYGSMRRFAAPADAVEPAVSLPEVRRYDVSAPRGLIRVEPTAPATLIDGSAAGVADLTALGALPQAGPLFYAGDVDGAEIRRVAARGGEVVITDSNRRRVFVASRPRQAVGWTIPATESFSRDAAVLDPFSGRGSAAQTTAVFEGARYVTAPYNPQIAEFPEHRPYAAFDGDPSTTWLADPTLDQGRHWIEVGLSHRRDVASIDVLPDSSNPLVSVTGVSVDGRPFAVHKGWNRLKVRLHDVDAVRVAITGQSGSAARSGSAGGFSEIRVPGIHVRELLRPPVLAERALRGADVSHTPLTYLFERTTADRPLRRGPQAARAVPGGRAEAEAALVAQAQDPEAGLDRTFMPPAARDWVVGGLATVAPATPDAVLDRLAATDTRGVVFASSGRFEGRPAFRASSAFDGSHASAWVAPLAGGRAWIAWRTRAPTTVSAIRLGRSPLPARRPVSVSVAADSARTAALPVAPDGTVRLPRPIRGSAFRLDVLSAAGPGAAAVAISDLTGPGVPRVVSSGAGQVAGRCGDLRATVGATPLALRPSGSVAALDAGDPLPVKACGPPVALGASTTDLTVTSRTLRPLLLRLRSPAPRPRGREPRGGGSVIATGTAGRGSYSGVRIAARGPSWLVLGESYNRGWRASCNGRSVGTPAVVDGFANGWRIGPSCRSASFTFGPQNAVSIGYVIGGIACLALIVLLLVRRPPRVPRGDRAPLPTAAASAWPLGRAIAAGAAGAVLGFAFGLRAGAVIGPAVAVVLWRGLSMRVLILTGGALLVVAVPAIYLAFPGTDHGGYDPNYAVAHLGAHWVALAALTLLTVALLRALSTATGRRARSRDEPPSAERERRVPA